MIIYREQFGRVTLKGQHSCILKTKEGLNIFSIRVISGKLRFNHGCFTPDGGAWLSAPTGGGTAHFDLEEPNEYTITVDIQRSFGRLDQINIVNLKFLKRAIFDYKILSN